VLKHQITTDRLNLVLPEVREYEVVVIEFE
jgi:hypothetical protein